MKLLDPEFIRRFYPGLSKYLARLYRFFFGKLSDKPFGPMHRLFLKSYFFYKRWWEDPFLPLVKKHPEYFRNGHILDVGACIGYTAELFSRAVPPPFLVYAFEPEPGNRRILEHVLQKEKMLSRILVLPDAVGAVSTTTEIWRNTMHHGDHRIATPELKAQSPDPNDLFQVRQWSLDDFCEQRGIIDQIAFIKIDVQGYEAEVLKGMGRVLASNPKLVVALEYCPVYFEPEANRRFFELIEQAGLKMHFIGKNGSPVAFEKAELDRQIRKRGYTDLLCARTTLV